MTEKRFSFNWERGHPNFWDNYCDLADCYLTCEDVVELLNEQHEQIERFKRNFKALDELKCEIAEENEQLKIKLEDIALENENAKESNDDAQYELYKLKKENEQLKQENKELRQDNDIKFWKLQCLQSSNNNQVMLFELSRAIQQGYEVSDKFKQYLDEIKEQDKEIREKHKRLFE